MKPDVSTGAEQASAEGQGTPGAAGFPQIHERHKITAKARYSICAAINDAAIGHGLTYAELFLILASEMAALSSYAVRDERQRPATPATSPEENCAPGVQK